MVVVVGNKKEFIFIFLNIFLTFAEIFFFSSFFFLSFFNRSTWICVIVVLI